MWELLYNIWAVNPLVMSLAALIPLMFIGYGVYHVWAEFFRGEPGRPRVMITDASDHLQRPINPHELPPPASRKPTPRVWGVDKGEG